jgi:hypothetical protein
MLEGFLRRQRRLFRLGALAYALFALIGLLAVCSPGGGIAVLVLFYSSPLAVVVTLLWRGDWLSPAGRALLRKTGVHGDAWTILRAIDAEAAGPEALWVGERATWRFWSLPRFALVTPNWLVQTDPEGVTLVKLADVLWVFRRCRSDSTGWGGRHLAHGYRIYYQPGSLETVSMPSPADADAVLGEILRHRPELLAGFGEPMRGMLAAGPAGFAAELQRRRGEWDRATEDERSAWQTEQLRKLDDQVQQLQWAEADPLTEQVSRKDSTALQPQLPAGSQGTSDPSSELSLSTMMAAERVHLNVLLAFAAVVTVSMTMICCMPFLTYPSSPGPGSTLVLMALYGAFVSGPWAAYFWRTRFRPILPRIRAELERHGAWRDVLRQIDEELQGGSEWFAGYWALGLQPFRTDALAVTRSWLIQVRPGRCVLVQLSDLVWVHKEVVPRRHLLPGPEFCFHLGCRLRGGETRIIRVASETILHQLFEVLLERRPGLLCGMHGSYRELAARGPAALTDAYERRAAEFAQLGEPQREEWLDLSWNDFQALIYNPE